MESNTTDPQEVQITPINLPHQKISRGSNFNSAEDLAVCKSYINISENPIDGTDMKGKVFFTKITDVYNKTFKPANRDERSMSSIKARSKAIMKQCMRFNSCYTRIQRSKPSGASPDDLIKLATNLFYGNRIDMASINEDIKPFRFLLCWKFLQDTQKFNIDDSGSPTKTRESSNDVYSSDSKKEEESCKESSGADEKITESCNVRPIGRKKAKRLLNRADNMSQKLKVAKEGIQVQRERTEALVRYSEVMLFCNAPGGCNDEDAVEYFNLMRRKALKRARKEVDEDCVEDNTEEGTN